MKWPLKVEKKISSMNFEMIRETMKLLKPIAQLSATAEALLSFS
jgi:hypothetical protein